LGPEFAFNSFSKCALAQTQVFSVLLAFLSLVMAGPIASDGAEINALSGRNFCSLIVQQIRGSLAARFKCKVYDLTAKLFCI
jgi:hypothetical protein